MKLILNVVLLLICFQVFSQTQNTKPQKMKVAVWDTYVTKKDGTIMHFDIIAPDETEDSTVIYNYGKEYLKTKNKEGQPLTTKEYKFCHIQALKHKW